MAHNSEIRLTAWRSRRAALRRMLGEAMARDLLAGGKPDAGQRLHARYETIQHGDAQRAPRHEGVQADVEIAALAILLHEARPPHVEHAIRVGEALLGVGGSIPGEGEEHGVVDGKVERQLEETGLALAVEH